jgi:hypothetical protein
MRTGDIYWMPIRFINKTRKKLRPVALLQVEGLNGNFNGYGVYTESDYWEKFYLIKSTFMYKPIDFNYANLAFDSYINVSDVYNINPRKLKPSDYKGKLSDRDVIGLAKAINKYEDFRSRVLSSDPMNKISYLDLREASVYLAKFYALDKRMSKISSYDFNLRDEDINFSKLDDFFRSAPQIFFKPDDPGPLLGPN